jgi:hypothetical protein
MRRACALAAAAALATAWLAALDLALYQRA